MPIKWRCFLYTVNIFHIYALTLLLFQSESEKFSIPKYFSISKDKLLTNNDHVLITFIHAPCQVWKSKLDHVAKISSTPVLESKSRQFELSMLLILFFIAPKISSTGARSGEYGGRKSNKRFKLFAMFAVSLDLCVGALSRVTTTLFFFLILMNSISLDSSFINTQNPLESTVPCFTNANQFPSLIVAMIRLALPLLGLFSIVAFSPLGNHEYDCTRDLSKLHSSIFITSFLFKTALNISTAKIPLFS